MNTKLLSLTNYDYYLTNFTINAPDKLDKLAKLLVDTLEPTELVHQRETIDLIGLASPTTTLENRIKQANYDVITFLGKIPKTIICMP